jgi:hypothetical protein
MVSIYKFECWVYCCWYGLYSLSPPKSDLVRIYRATRQEAKIVVIFKVRRPYKMYSSSWMPEAESIFEYFKYQLIRAI